jgi:hypothetical protein
MRAKVDKNIINSCYYKMKFLADSTYPPDVLHESALLLGDGPGGFTQYLA